MCGIEDPQTLSFNNLAEGTDVFYKYICSSCFTRFTDDCQYIVILEMLQQ